MSLKQDTFSIQRAPGAREIKQIDPPFFLAFVRMIFEAKAMDAIASAHIPLEILAIHFVAYRLLKLKEWRKEAI